MIFQFLDKAHRMLSDLIDWSVVHLGFFSVIIIIPISLIFTIVSIIYKFIHSLWRTPDDINN